MKIIATCLIAMTVAGATLSAQTSAQWSRIQDVRLGEIIVVNDESGGVFRGRLLRADAESILLYAPLVATTELKSLDAMSRDRPALLARVDRVGLNLADSELQISLDGIAKNGVKIAAFDQVFHVSPRTSVVSVIRPKDQRHAYLPAIAGVAIGALAGVFGSMPILLSDEPCQPHCGPRVRAGYAVMFGAPILGGLIGGKLGQPHDDQVIYRR